MQVKRAADATIGSDRLDGVARDRVLARSLGADHRLLERAPTTLLRREMFAVDWRPDLIVRRLLGTDDLGQQRYADEVRLPAGYVTEHVELGYASTIHSAQGQPSTRPTAWSTTR